MVWLWRFLRRALFVVTTLTAIAVAVVWWLARPADPDEFYQAAPPPGSSPGTLLRSEPFTKAVPAGAVAWRILYTTTRIDNSPAVASAVVVVANRAPTSPRPVIAWAHGTTGIASGCAPSVMDDPFANVPAMDLIVREGWAYVATDYVGLGTSGGHAYLVGDDAARAVLDAIRAARRLAELNLGDRVVVWGHSQGGNSALWTGIRAPTAPDLKVVGIAALAPASDLKALIQSARTTMFGKIVSSLVTHAYSSVYPDVKIRDYVRWRARFLARDIASRCVGGWPTLVSVAATKLLPSDGIFETDPTGGAFGARLLENTPTNRIEIPVLIAQGQIDDLVLPDVQKRFVEARCASGQPLEYRTYVGLDHVSLVGKESPLGADLMAWTRARLDDRPAANTCRQ